MYPNHVVVREMQGDRRPMILHLLGEAVGEARKSLYRHRHGEVLPLDEAC